MQQPVKGLSGGIFLRREPIARGEEGYSSDESQSHEGRRDIPPTRANRARGGGIFSRAHTWSSALESTVTLMVSHHLTMAETSPELILGVKCTSPWIRNGSRWGTPAMA
eukprot:548116-Pyramimonas_sp.AAC.1